MANKLTKREWFERLAVVVEGSGIEDEKGALEFIQHEIELLDKKKSNSGTSKRKESNIIIKETVCEVLTTFNRPATITELMCDERLTFYVEETKDGVVEKRMTNQKLSSLIKQLMKEGKVNRVEEKKKAYFSLAQ